MEVERRDMDYTVMLTIGDLNALLGYSNPDHVELPLTAKVQGPIEETLSLSCTRNPKTLEDSRTNDGIFFEHGEKGPEVQASPQALVSLLGSREFWVTRYDGSNKIWLRPGVGSEIDPR